MNNPHRNARMTPLGRAEMVRRIVEEGRPVAEVAAGFGVSERTARKWLARYRREGAWGLENRPSRPHAVANRTLDPWIDLMESLRLEYRLTAEEIATRLKLACSTVAAWLKRRGLGRLKFLEKPMPVRRYQRQRPGELLHLDIKKLARFDRVGHRITGNRLGASEHVGYDFFHVAIDDATRLAYVEALPDERRSSTTGFLVRALRWFRARGIRVERVMTDNGSGYVARLFRKALRMLGIRHIRTRPDAEDQRQGRALHPDAHARMGLRPIGITASGRMLASTDDHRFRPSPEQPNRILHLADLPSLDQCAFGAGDRIALRHCERSDQALGLAKRIFARPCDPAALAGRIAADHGETAALLREPLVTDAGRNRDHVAGAERDLDAAVTAEADLGLADDAGQRLVAGHMEVPIVEDAVDPVSDPVVLAEERLRGARRPKRRRERLWIKEQREQIVRDLAVRREGEALDLGFHRDSSLPSQPTEARGILYR